MQKRIKDIIVDIKESGNTNPFLSKFDSHLIESLSDKDRDSLFNLVYTAQTQTIAKGFERGEDIVLPALGTFKIKPVRRKAVQIHRDELDKRGVDHISGLPEEERLVVKSVIGDKVKNVINTTRINKVKIKSSTIKLRIKKKSK